jgi:hypothetical protein
MKPLSSGPFAAVLLALTALMIATRVNHFGTAIHLPDASMAVFFLGGLYLRRHLLFFALAVLTGVLDWASISLAGVSDFCITPAYSFMLPAYAVLWYGGRLYTARLTDSAASSAGAIGVGLVSATLSFVISNGAFYWLGGRYADPHFAEYVARLLHWAPLFVRVAMAYIVVAMLVHVVIARVGHSRLGDRQARA